MKKTLLVLTAVLAACSAPLSFAQTGAAPHGASAAPDSSSLTRFNLDFPGGTPAELAQFISRATKKHLNLIVPEQHAHVKIMPIRVENVTVPDLFSAIEMASRREVPIVVGIASGPRASGPKSIQYRSVSLSFTSQEKNADFDTVWSFTSTEPTPEDAAVLASTETADENVCQYFQLSPYLQDHSVEDITTAIQTGWKMLKVNPAPQLSFHEETKLLIAVGAATHVAQIPAVLAQLPLDNTAAVEKIAKWQAELADIESAKGADWENRAKVKREQIERAAGLQKARETIQNSTRPFEARRPVSPIPSLGK